MNNKIVIGVAFMLVLTISTACSQDTARTVARNERPMMNQTVSGSYIASAPGAGELAVRRVFAEYGIVSVTPLGNDQYELRLNRDPGIEALSISVNNSGGLIRAIQPNFTYRINN
jgi:hypothetical protein